MRSIVIISSLAAASALSPLGAGRGVRAPQLSRTGISPLMSSYEEYLASRRQGGGAPPQGAPAEREAVEELRGWLQETAQIPSSQLDRVLGAVQEQWVEDVDGLEKNLDKVEKVVPAAAFSQISNAFSAPTSPGANFNPRGVPAGSEASDADYDNYERIPWWKQSSTYSEIQRKDRRTIFMHDDWVRHRSSARFFRNLRSITSSGINQALSKELAFVTFCSAFVVLYNMVFFQYQDLAGVTHDGMLNFGGVVNKLTLPALPFSIAMPALSLLLVFRTNTAYFRWNEARTLWGGLINNCRNVVRQSNTYFPDDAEHAILKRRISAETGAFIKALKNFLRGPTDDDTFRSELYEWVDAGVMSREQADATMASNNRPMVCLQAMSATLRKANLDPIDRARIDTTISVLVDLTGANERIFKSPIPLVYTRLTSRFLSIFLIMLPLALWGQLGDSWNHWATIPAEFVVAFFLFGIEEVGVQIEEPFSVLPLEAFCNGAIKATYEEMSKVWDSGVWDEATY